MLARLAARRLLIAVPVLICVYTLTFFLVRAAPGGPFDEERIAPPSVMEALEKRYNLNDPLWKQYLDYGGKALQGDLGPSFRYPSRRVSEIIVDGLWVTAELGLWALLLALVVGVAAGVLAAVRPYTAFDYVPMSMAMIGVCLPSFLLGPLLALIFGIWLEWLPVSGWGVLPGDKVLPILTMSSVYIAYIARLTRGGMLEVLSMDYVRTARAKGVPEARVVLVHALRGGIVPVVAFLGPAIAGILAGSFVVETVFSIPGIGRYYVQAAFNRDYTLVMGMTLFLSTLIIVFNLLSDILAAWLDPRSREITSGGS